MTQIGESVSLIVDTGGDKETCIFCESDHQDEAPAPAHNFGRDMSKLKREGRRETISLGRSPHYPDEEKPPLVEWPKDITRIGGYKAAAHHCVALKTASAHRISGELKEALVFFDTAIKIDPRNILALKGKEKTNNLINKKIVSDV